MKNHFFTTLALILFSAILFAQDNSSRSGNWEQRTLFKNGDVSHGGYGGLMLKYGQLNNSSALIIGAKGAWVINHFLGIGISGQGVVAQPEFYDVGTGYYTGYTGGSGGFLIEPVLFSDSPVHLAIPIVLGGGIVGSYTYYNDRFIGKEKYSTYAMIEPGLELELNLVNWFRVAVGVHYAFRTEVYGTANFDYDAMSPFSTGVSFKFGAF